MNSNPAQFHQFVSVPLFPSSGNRSTTEDLPATSSVLVEEFCSLILFFCFVILPGHCPLGPQLAQSLPDCALIVSCKQPFMHCELLASASALRTVRDRFPRQTAPAKRLPQNGHFTSSLQFSCRHAFRLQLEENCLQTCQHAPLRDPDCEFLRRTAASRESGVGDNKNTLSYFRLKRNLFTAHFIV